MDKSELDRLYKEREDLDKQYNIAAYNEQAAELDKQIAAVEREVRINELVEEGKVVRSIDDLVCKKHPEADFIVVGKIPYGYYFEYEIYLCEECITPEIKQKLKSDPSQINRLIILDGISLAYQCPRCSIVIGEINIRKYNNIQALSGTAGNRFYCKLCDKQLGEHINRWS